jgi:uncharacterized protein YegP (UPF0339 family)
MNTPVKKKKNGSKPKIEVVKPTGERQKRSLKNRFRAAVRSFVKNTKAAAGYAVKSGEGYTQTASKQKSIDAAKKIMDKRNTYKRK